MKENDNEKFGQKIDKRLIYIIRIKNKIESKLSELSIVMNKKINEIMCFHRMLSHLSFF